MPYYKLYVDIHMHYAYHSLCGFYIVIQNLYSPISLYVHMYVGIVIICMYLLHNVCMYIYIYVYNVLHVHMYRELM